jgi:hypothetical protein
MFYFKELKTLRIVTRQYQYNLEAIDGKLVEIEAEANCLLLGHVPNKKWSYDVTILQKLDAEDGVRHLNPLPQKSDQPKEFYAVVLEGDYDEYIRDYAFREVKGKTKEPKPNVIIKANPKPKIIDTGDAKTNVGTVPISSDNFTYLPSLTRTGEKTVYKFRSGSQKYG